MFRGDDTCGPDALLPPSELNHEAWWHYYAPSNEPAVLEGLGYSATGRRLSCGVGERYAGRPTCQSQQPTASSMTF
jgi:hypothetical protein